MSELETVSLLAFVFMTALYFVQRKDIRKLRSIIIDVGLKVARVEVDEDTHVVRVIRK